MSSSLQPSSSLHVHNCTAPLLDFDLQEKFLHATELNSKNIDALMQKISENETQNTNLRRKILEREKHVKELSSRLQLEKVNVQKEDHLSRSVKAVQAHLQCQIQRKEVENEELKVKIQEVKLSEILSASDICKSQHDRMVGGKTTLQIETEDLRKQITSLLEDLKRKEEWRRNSDEGILGKLNSVNSENEKIYLENEKLKASLATLENSTVSVESELLNLQEEAKLQENLAEQYKNQVQKLQRAVEELKSKYETVLNENKRIKENKCLELDKVRDKTEAELKELEHVCDLWKAAEEKHQGYQGKLTSPERIHAPKCAILRELQVQEEDTVDSLGSHSLEEENRNIQNKYENLKRQLEKMEFQNEELACQLRKEDERLQCSKLQLEEKIAEYNGLTRQLESALEEGRKMVAEELEKMSYKDQALQTKMLILETEVREGQEEKKKLLCLFHHNEKHREVRLKELENSLQKSENKNQSIQNYVQFLKASYITMFG
ncbi:protein BCAP isoform X5 [Strix uralensis]|uniref:protein BCAP isoform X5 n=1 Tax=Strix uralensis TaxID=36305 RepID=UPI003DA6DDCF